jgi:hypothetical protein
MDRILIALLCFISVAAITGAGYWFVASNNERAKVLPYRLILPTPETPLERKSGEEARFHFLLVCTAAGALASLFYIVSTIRDPYGTTTARQLRHKQDGEGKKDRFAFLKNRD